MTRENQFLAKWLASQRMIAGITQIDLAKSLNKPQSFVAKYENGERKLDFFEVIAVCHQMKTDIHELIRMLEKESEFDNL